MKRILLIITYFFCYVLSYGQPTPSANPLDKVGDTATITGRIYAGSFLKNVKTKPTFLNLWDSLPNHRLMIRIEPEDRDKFPTSPETYFLNKKVSVKGVVDNYKGTALIKISAPNMIQVEQPPAIDTTLNQNNIFKNRVAKGKITDADKTGFGKADTVLQSKWINSVAGRSFEQTLKDVRIVQKEIPLRVSPNDEAPVIAELQRGIAISILYKSRKWSYITVRKPDGTSSVFGFIKNRRFKHLKKEK